MARSWTIDVTSSTVDPGSNDIRVKFEEKEYVDGTLSQTRTAEILIPNTLEDDQAAIDYINNLMANRLKKLSQASAIATASINPVENSVQEQFVLADVTLRSCREQWIWLKGAFIDSIKATPTLKNNASTAATAMNTAYATRYPTMRLLSVVECFTSLISALYGTVVRHSGGTPVRNAQGGYIILNGSGTITDASTQMRLISAQTYLAMCDFFIAEEKSIAMRLG